MAPVISTMSNFISWWGRGREGGEDSPDSSPQSRQQVARDANNNCPLPVTLSPYPRAQKCFLCHSAPRPPHLLPASDLPVLHNKTVATPLHATSFCIIRHQRPPLLMTAAPHFRLKHLKAKREGGSGEKKPQNNFSALFAGFS